MHRLRLLRFSVPVVCGAALFIATAISLLVSHPASAQTSADCNSGVQVSYIGELQVPKQEYDVYVRLGKRGQLAPASLFVRPNPATNECREVGTVDASGDEWRLVGRWAATDDKAATIFQLSSSALSSSPTANRPVIMLLDHKNPLCSPKVECETLYNGQKGYIRPGGTLLNQNTLHVLRAVNPEDDTVLKVDYYVDNQIKYSSGNLRPFDLRYVSSDRASLLRIVSYKSGQRLFLEDTVPANYRDSFIGFLFRFAHFNPRVVTAIEIFLSLAVGLGALSLSLHWLHRRHRWRADHGLEKEHKRNVVTPANSSELKRRAQTSVSISHIFTISGVLLAVITFVAVLNIFIVQMATVTGRSMEQTYKNGSKVFVNKIAKTWSLVRSREYVPSRGSVVVVRPVFGTADISMTDPVGSPIVKRVIALPGERVIVQHGVITVYNEEHPNGFNPDAGAAWQESMVPGSDTEEYVDVVLGASELFVSGDNRPASVDSRYNGPVTTQNIIGTVIGGKQ